MEKKASPITTLSGDVWKSKKSSTQKLYLVEDDYNHCNNVGANIEESFGDRNRRLLKQAFMVFMSSLGMWTVGSVISYPSVISYDMETHNTTIFDTEIVISEEKMDEFSSLKTIAALPGSWLFAALMPVIGRKLCMLFSGLIMIVGWLGISLATNVDIMLAARIISGFGIGGMSVSVNTYVVELSDPAVRGTMATIVNVGILAGQLFTMALGYGLRYYTVGFLNLIPPVMFIISLVFLPESPGVLVLKGRIDEARRILSKLRGKHADIDDEIRNYIEMNQTNTEDKSKSFWAELFSEPVMKPIIKVSILFILMHFTGYYVVSANTSRIFRDAGSSIDDNLASVITTSVQLVAGMAASIPLDRLGRRKSLMMSYALMCVPLAVMAAYSGIYKPMEVNEENDYTQYYGWIPVVCLMVSQAAVVLGVNPVPFILSNEYFPTSIRSQASSICFTVSTFVGFIVLQFYTPMEEAMTQTGLFALYSSVCIIGIPFTYFFIEETKGKQVG